MTSEHPSDREFRRFVYEIEVEVDDRSSVAAQNLSMMDDGTIVAPGDDFGVAQAVLMRLGKAFSSDLNRDTGVRFISGSLMARELGSDGQWAELTLPAVPARAPDGTVPGIDG